MLNFDRWLFKKRQTNSYTEWAGTSRGITHRNPLNISQRASISTEDSLDIRRDNLPLSIELTISWELNSTFTIMFEMRVTIGQSTSGLSIFWNTKSETGTTLWIAFCISMAPLRWRMILFKHWQHPINTSIESYYPPDSLSIKLRRTSVREFSWSLLKASIQPETMDANFSLKHWDVYMYCRIYKTGISCRCDISFFLQVAGSKASTLNKLLKELRSILLQLPKWYKRYFKVNWESTVLSNDE